MKITPRWTKESLDALPGLPDSRTACPWCRCTSTEGAAPQVIFNPEPEEDTHTRAVTLYEERYCKVCDSAWTVTFKVGIPPKAIPHRGNW